VRSHEQDSFSAGLLDCPHYSRPELLGEGSGGAACRRCCSRATMPRSSAGGGTRALALTAERRPDLVARAEAEGRLSAADREALARARAPKL
jgi:tRNA (guanine37-N1)-methyltransferase